MGILRGLCPEHCTSSIHIHEFTNLFHRISSRAGIQTQAMVTPDSGTESVTPIAEPYAILGAIFKYPICKIGADSCIPQVGGGGTYKA